MRTGPIVRLLLVALVLWSGWACTDTLVEVVDVATIEITPASPTLSPGETVQLNARLRDGEGNTLTDRSVQWSSQSPAAASVSGDGLVLGVGEGTSMITASSDGVQASVQVAVSPAPVIVATPDSVPLAAVLGEGDTPAASVAITNGGGGTLAGLSATVEYDAGATDWLDAVLSGPIAPATLVVGAEVDGLARGTYRASVRLTSTSTGTSPVIVRVVLNVLQRTAAPSLISVTPGTSAREQSLDVIMTGANFVPDLTTVSFGSGITVNGVNVQGPTTLTAAITVGASAAVGERDVSVTNPPPGGGTAVLESAFNVEGLNPRPTLTGVEPASAQRQSTLDVTLEGTGFLDDVTIADFGPGVTVNTTDVTSATSLVANITLAAGAATGLRDVTVANPEPGGGVGTLRNAFTVTAANPAPTFTDVSPASGQRLETLDVQLTGSHFADGLTSISFGADIAVTSMSVASATVIDAEITVAATAALGARSVSVTNAAPGGGTVTLAGAFTVLDAYPVPDIQAVAPPSVRLAQTRDVVLTGSGFVEGVTTLDFGAGVTVNSVSVADPASLTASVTAAGDATPGVRSITATNPAPGGGSMTLDGAFTVTGAVSSSLSSVSAAPSTDVAADGTAVSTVTVVVRDEAGGAIEGIDPSSFVVDVTGSASAGAVVETAMPGTYRFTVSNTVAETVSVSVGVEGVDLDDTPTIGFVATIVSAQNSSVSADPLTGITADGTAASVVTVVLRDPNDNALGGLAATAFALTVSGSATAASITETTTAGTYTFTVTNTVAESVTVQVSAGGTALDDEPVLQFTAGAVNAANSGVIAAPATGVVANGSAMSTVTVTLRDGANNPVGGVAPASFSIDVTGSAAETAVTETDTAGTYTFGVSNTVAQSVTVTVTASGVTLTGSPTIQFVAGAATQIALNDGDNQSATIGAAVATAPSVIVLDANDNPVAGVVVTFAVATGGGSLTAAGAVSTNTSGLATSPAWTLGTTAGPNTLTATSAGLTGSPVTFTATATAGSASRMSITTQPSATAVTGAAFATQPVIQLRDASDNPVADAGIVVTASIATGGGTLGGTTTATTNASGVATFANLSIAGLVGSRTLQFSATGITPVTSNAIAITAGPATQMSVNAGNVQSATIGSTVAVRPSVLVTDMSGNPIAGVAVTFALGAGGGSLGGSGAVVTNTSGIATAPAWTLGSVAGANTVTATSAGLTGSPITFTATATSGNATQMTIATQPSATAQSGAAFAVQPVVQIRDNGGNTVAEADVVIIATIATGGGALGGTATATTNAAGVATFTNLAITGAAGTRTLQFASGGMPNVNSSGIAIAAGAATQLTVATQPSASAQSGAAFVQQPSVQLLDGGGNAVTTAGVNVTASIATGGGTLAGTATVATNASGIATFTNLAISGLTGNRTLRFTSDGLTAVVSNTISVGTGAAADIAMYSGDGQSAAVGTAVSSPIVRVRDANGNNVQGVNVTFAITGGAGSLGSGGPVVSTNADGLAISPAWTLGTTAGTNTLTATAAGLSGSPVTFTATATAGGVSRVSIATQPSATAVNGAAFGTQPIIQLHDGFNNPVADPGVVITASIATGSGTLGGTTTATTNAAGVATFTNLSITGTAGGRTLQFSAPGITPATSNAIAITAGPATQMSVNAGNNQIATIGESVAVQPSVLVTDVSGNPVGGVAVTFAVGAGGGSLGGSGAVTTNASGVATSPSWTLGTIAGANTLTASSVGLTGSPITFTATGTAGTASRMSITMQPSATAVNGAAFATQPIIQLRDASDNPVADAGIVVTASIASGGGTLGGTATATTNASGAATFTNLSITGTTGSRTLQFGAPGITAATSNAVAITAGSATQMTANGGNNQSATIGESVAVQPSVLVTDVSGNPAASVAVTFAVGTGGGSLGGSGAVTTNASGVATSPAWTLGTIAGANTLTASSAGLAGSPITFTATATAGSASRMSVTTQPSATAVNGAPFATQPVIQLRDASDNPVADEGVVVTASIATGGGTLGGTVTATTNASGVATFTNLSITGTTGGRTLQFSAPGITPATSNAIATTVGPATQMTVNAGNNQNATIGDTVAVRPSVLATDVSGNPIAGVPVTFAVGTGGGSLGGSGAVNTNDSGIATSPAWTLGTTAGANTLTATAGGLTGSPVTFAATGTAGVATQMTITAQPSVTAQSGVAFAVQPTIQIRDSGGNAVAEEGVVITASISSGDGTLGGTATATTDATGLATFSGLVISGLTGDRTLTFTSDGLTAVVSNTISVGPGAATQLAITTQPPATVASGVEFTPQPVIQLRDAWGNPVLQGGIVVTASVEPGGTGVLSGTATANTVNGVATFETLTLTGAAGSNTLRFTAPGLAPVVSAAVDIVE